MSSLFQAFGREEVPRGRIGAFAVLRVPSRPLRACSTRWSPYRAEHRLSIGRRLLTLSEWT